MELSMAVFSLQSALPTVRSQNLATCKMWSFAVRNNFLASDILQCLRNYIELESMWIESVRALLICVIYIYIYTYTGLGEHRIV